MSPSDGDVARGLCRRIGELEYSIREMGFEPCIGVEDEFYVAGPGAESFLGRDSNDLRILRRTFPEVGRVYREADVLAVRGTPLRLRLPSIQKWEITTTHTTARGEPIAPSRQARVVNGVREFVLEAAKTKGLLVHSGPRPVPDIRALFTQSSPLVLLDAGEALSSLKRQVASGALHARCRWHLRNRVAVTAFEYLSTTIGWCQPEAITAALRSALIIRDFAPLERIAGGRSTRMVQAMLEDSAATAAAQAVATERSLTGVRSFLELCDGAASVIAPDAAPGCGVDANLSLLRGASNAFHDPASADQTSPLCRGVATELVLLFGRRTGSLLPAIQSCSQATFSRLGRVDLDAPSRAAVGPKATGASCKVSPDRVALNPARAVDHDHDRFAPGSVRVEVRVGESGGALGGFRPSAILHYVLVCLVAARNGIERSSRDCPPEWPVRDQPLDASLAEAIESFSASRLLRSGYGPVLHEAVIAEATVRAPTMRPRNLRSAADVS